MRKLNFFSLFFTLVLFFALFSSCKKEEDKNEDDLIIGWTEWTIKDKSGTVVDQGKKLQRQEDWMEAYCDVLEDGWIHVAGESLDTDYHSLVPGVYPAGREKNVDILPLGTFDCSIMVDHLELVPSKGETHTVEKVENLGRNIDGYSLYAIDGSCSIKLSDYNGNGDGLYSLSCKYHIIAKSDYLAENH